MNELVRDLRTSARRLARSPGFCAAVVLTLALGLGANGAVFSLVRGVLLRPLPYADPEDLVRVFHAHRQEGLEQGAFSPPDREDLERSVDERAGAADGVFASTGAFWFSPGQSGMNLIGGGQPLVVQATFVSDGFWHRRFAADPEVVGRTLALDGERFTVVGVMPGGFVFPAEESDLWAPVSLIGEDSIPRLRALRWQGLVARLSPGVSAPAVEGAVEEALERLAREYPETNEG